jgi:hypothetical protein
LRRAAFSVAANIVEGFAHSPGRAPLNFPQSLARVSCRSRLLHPRRAASRLHLGSGCKRAGNSGERGWRAVGWFDPFNAAEACHHDWSGRHLARFPDYAARITDRAARTSAR